MLLSEGTLVNHEEIALAPSISNTSINNTLPIGSAVVHDMRTSLTP